MYHQRHHCRRPRKIRGRVSHRIYKLRSIAVRVSLSLVLREQIQHHHFSSPVSTNPLCLSFKDSPHLLPPPPAHPQAPLGASSHLSLVRFVHDERDEAVVRALAQQQEEKEQQCVQFRGSYLKVIGKVKVKTNDENIQKGLRDL